MRSTHKYSIYRTTQWDMGDCEGGSIFPGTIQVQILFFFLLGNLFD